jgi:spore germination cell wall hydrolase CwlJ-like protein
MNLRDRAIEGVVVAASLIMMSAVASTAGDVSGQLSAETAVANEKYAVGNGTAGVVASLDETWNQTLTSIETEADIEKTEISLVALSEMETQAGETDNAETTVQVAQEEGAEPDEAADDEAAGWENRLMAVVDEYLNIRASGDENAQIVGKLYKGAVAEVVERGDTWTHIVSGNVDGYVSNDYCVYGTDAYNYANENVDTTATVQTNSLRIRSAANLDASVIYSVSTGTTLVVDTDEETTDEWVAVNYKGPTAYVSADYVTTELALTEGVTIEEEAAAKKAAEEAAAAEAAKKAEEAAAAAAQAEAVTVQNEAVAASVDDVTLLAALIQCEAGNESYEGQLAVGAVVMNRVRSGGYPSTVYDVVYQRSQFPPAASGSVAAVAARGPKASCMQAAQEAINGADNTGGAHGFARASSGRAGVVIGNHVFY